MLEYKGVKCMVNTPYFYFHILLSLYVKLIQELCVNPRAGLNQLKTAEIGPVEQPYNELWENFDMDCYGRNVLTT